jgi:hypothetical protein
LHRIRQILNLNDQAGGTASSQKAPASADDNWHFAISPYLWFAGVHGNVGARGYTASVHANAADVLSKFNIGLMGAVEARKKRFLLPVDFMWIKMSDDKALPALGDPNANSIKAKMTSTILSPKAGYRLVDHEKLQADALIGIRYWHTVTNFTLEPKGLGTATQSANWVDVVAAAKFIMPLSPEL